MRPGVRCGRVARGRGDEYLPFTGQTAGLINDVRPAAGKTVLAEAEAALTAAARHTGYA